MRHAAVIGLRTLRAHDASDLYGQRQQAETKKRYCHAHVPFLSYTTLLLCKDISSIKAEQHRLQGRSNNLERSD